MKGEEAERAAYTQNTNQMSLEDAVKGKVGAFPSPSTGSFVFKTIMFILFMTVSLLIGFYFGKIHESRNYVRVGMPPSN